MLVKPYFSPDPDPTLGAAPPAEVTVEKAIDVLSKDEGYVVMTKDDFSKKEAHIRKDEAINSVGKTHGMYDDLFKEVSGIDKDDKEKTVAYGKRVIGSMVEKATGGPNDQITGLTQQLEDTKVKYNDLQAEVVQTKENYAKDILQRDINNDYQVGLSNVLPNLAYKDDNEKKLALAGFKSEFFETYEVKVDESGVRQVIEKSSGAVVQDDKLVNQTPSQVVQEFAQSMLKLSNGASGGGAGTKPPSSKGLPPISNMVELDTYLESVFKSEVGGPEWVIERNKLEKELALR